MNKTHLPSLYDIYLKQGANLKKEELLTNGEIFYNALTIYKVENRQDRQAKVTLI